MRGNFDLNKFGGLIIIPCDPFLLPLVKNDFPFH